MSLKFFDMEVFPDWWCLVVSDEEPSYKSKAYTHLFDKEEETSIKSKMRIYTSDTDRVVTLDAIKKDMSVGVLTGYNIKGYDLIILKALLAGFTPHQLHVLSEIIISNKNYAVINKDHEHVRIAQYAKGIWRGCESYQDLMDDSVKSLKDKECAFGMDIRETTVPFDKVNLTQQDKDDIIFYCKHDVYALHVLYVDVSKPYIDTKLALCKTYEIDPIKVGYPSTNAVLTGKVVGAERVHGTTIVDPTIKIYQPKLKEYIERWVPADVLEHLLTKQSQLKKTMFGNTVVMADGGLHSVFDTPKVGRESSNLYVEATDTWGLYNVDASSCYPSCMIYCGSMPRSITMPERFKQIFERRRNLKKIPKSQWSEDDKVFVPGGKLVLNTTYGAAGNEYLPIYDDYMRSKTCRIGQLILLAVAHSLQNAIPDLKVIQTNTDGILVYCRRLALPILQERVKEFEDLSGFEFELEEDQKIWQLNVNNYIAQGIDGHLKLKGESFVTEVWQKGTNRVRPLNNHIIAKTQIDYYVKGINPIKALLENTNVADMCITCTKGPTYFGMVQKNTNGDLALGKVARVIATTTEKYGVVKKQKHNTDGSIKEDTCAECPPHTWVINDDLNNYEIVGPFNNRELVHKPTGMRAKIDYNYYVEELNDALDLIWYELKDGQLKLTKKFNLDGGE